MVMEAEGEMAGAMVAVALIALMIVYNLSFKRISVPGPRPWPVIGNLNLFQGPIHLVLKDLAWKYGGVCNLWMGSVPTVIVAQTEAIHEALVHNGKTFASRPQPFSWQFFTFGYKTCGSLVYGQEWIRRRSVLKANVLGSAALAKASCLDTRDIVSRRIVKYIGAEAMKNNGIVEPVKVLHLQQSALVMRLCFGQEFDISLEDGMNPECKGAQLEKICAGVFELQNRLIVRIGDCISWTRMLPHSKEAFRNFSDNVNQVERLLLPFIRRQRRLLDSGESQRDESCFVDILLGLSGEEALTDHEILYNLLELIVAGSDTTTESIHWCLALLTAFPDHQQRAFEEIEMVVGLNRLAQDSDMEKLPYLRAFIKETIRLHMPSQVGLPHATTHKVSLNGYEIPAQTHVIFLFGAAANDPEIWESPWEFRPERFLEELTPRQKAAYMPFGIGRRVCPGAQLATLNVELTLARLLQAYAFRPAEPNQAVDLTENMKLVVALKTPLRASIGDRKACKLDN